MYSTLHASGVAGQVKWNLAVGTALAEVWRQFVPNTAGICKVAVREEQHYRCMLSRIDVSGPERRTNGTHDARCEEA